VNRSTVVDDAEQVATPMITPGLRLPRHRSTTAHLASLYPCQANDGLGARGVLMGIDLESGGSTFHYDPFELYAQKVITSPNILILGLVGSGKSTVVKTLLYRSIGILASPGGQPRFCAIADPKGEYGPLAEALGLSRLALRPGGSTRLNPLDPGPRHGTLDELATRRMHMVGALTAGVLDRALRPVEDAAIGWAIDSLTTSWDDKPTLGDVCSLLGSPTGEMVQRSGIRDEQLVDEIRDARYAIQKLLERDLAGMFDGQSTERIDWQGRGVVIDTSAVNNTTAQPLVMIAATAWLQQLLAVPESETVPRRYQVLEEIWSLLGNPHVARYYQASQKLSRTYGVCNIAVAHRIEDLRAQADDGSAAAKIGAGIIADTQTQILFHLPPAQAEEAQKLLGLSNGAANQLTTLQKGEAIWKVGDHLTRVYHLRSKIEERICDTDQNL
jgi:type IV secretory pathway VirB4 component